MSKYHSQSAQRRLWDCKSDHTDIHTAPVQPHNYALHTPRKTHQNFENSSYHLFGTDDPMPNLTVQSHVSYKCPHLIQSPHKACEYSLQYD